MTGTPIRDLPEHTQRAINNALKKETAKETKTEKSWIKTVDDAKALIDSIENDKPYAQLSNGRFEVLPRFHHGNPVWLVRPADGRFVPCGFFTPLGLKMLIAFKEDSQ